MSNDIAIQSVGAFPAVPQTNKKPAYLVVLSPEGKSTKSRMFIALHKPELLNGFIQVKGMFSSASETKIVKEYNELLTSANKENFVEVMFPWHKVLSIRSLVFKAK